MKKINKIKIIITILFLLGIICFIVYFVNKNKKNVDLSSADNFDENSIRII